MKIQFKGTETAGATPDNVATAPVITERELSFNLTDKKIFSRKADGTLVEFMGGGGDIDGGFANSVYIAIQSANGGGA